MLKPFMMLPFLVESGQSWTFMHSKAILIWMRKSSISEVGSPAWTCVPQKNRRRKIDAPESPSKSLQACALREHNLVLTDNVRGGHSSDVQQHIQHLPIRQLAAKAVHRAEQHAIRDRHEQFPIALGSSDWGLKIGRPYDQILAIRAIPIQFIPMATEAVLFIHRLPFLGIYSGSLPDGPGTSQQDQEHHTDQAKNFHAVNFSLVGGVGIQSSVLNG
jgi:hypothetical protein